MMPCILVFRRCFGGTYCLHFQNRRLSQGSNQQEVGGLPTQQYGSSILIYVILNTATCPLKAGIVYSEETSVTRLRHKKEKHNNGALNVTSA
jgi:hypothetical protein